MAVPARQTQRRIGVAQRPKLRLRPEHLLCVFVAIVFGVQYFVFRGADVPPPTSTGQGERPSPPKSPQQLQQLRKSLADSLHSANNIHDENPSSSPPADFPPHYTLFSTSCSSSQNWQSFVFFFFAHKVRQPGHVIRIASGCTPQQQEELTAFHESTVSKLSPDFHVHFTPDFTNVSGDNYKYYNKPFGVRHWLEHWLRYEEKVRSGDDAERTEAEDSIVMILDPDMALMRPLTYDFTDSNVLIHKSKRGPPKVKKVMHGQPWASLYAFGDGPFRVDQNYVFANRTDSPALSVTDDDKHNSFPGGPPYMATGKDMWAIVNAWCELVPRVHHVYEHLLGEMYGWSLGAAHVGLPHVLSESFMISATQISEGEGWPLIDALDDDDVCLYSTTKENEDKLPYTMHYCQNYWLGKWFIGKYRLDSNFLSCDAPLLMEPPHDIGKKYDFFIKPGGVPYGRKEKMQPKIVKREQFMICQMIARLNDAATWFKDNTCDEGTANYEKSFIFHHNLDPDNNEGGEKKAKW